MDCVAYLIGPTERQGASIAEAQGNCETVRYFAIQTAGPSIAAPPVGASLAQRRWPFMHEYGALANLEARKQIADQLTQDAPDVIFVDHVYSTLFLADPVFRRWPVVTIALNREGEFFAELAERGTRFYDAPPSAMAAFRVRRFERSVLRKSAAVAAIGAHDLPGGRLSKKSPSGAALFGCDGSVLRGEPPSLSQRVGDRLDSAAFRA